MKDDNLAEWSVGDLKSVLTELKLKTTRAKKELLDRLLPFTRSDNNLLEKRLKEVKKIYVFQTSMDPTEIPPPSSAWGADQSLFPKVDATAISQYTGFKRQGRKGQYRKAQRLFSPRKIKTVKVHKDGEVTFVKAMIIKSFGQEITRPAVLVFKDNYPMKGYCECPIGKCGICSHTVALLFFLEHYSKHKVSSYNNMLSGSTYSPPIIPVISSVICH